MSYPSYAHIVGCLNLMLAAIAIFCVVTAEDHPEHFALVFVTVSIFIYYIATVLIIVIIEIFQVRQNFHQGSTMVVSMDHSRT